MSPALPREERDVIRALLDEGQRYEMGSLTERFWLRDVVDRVPALLDALDAADAVLAAVADHDGLADVLAAHVQHEEQAIVDGHVWCASCDTQIGDWTRERGIEALDAMWTAHLADVVRAWMAQP